MRFLLVIFLCIFAGPLFANTEIKTQIYDIDMGRVNEEPLIFLTTGLVVTFPSADKALFIELRGAIEKKTWYLVTVNEKREIIKMEVTVSPPTSTRNELKALKGVQESYTPSILRSLDVARNFFYEARTNAREESQCYNRAHVWTYEWRTNRNLYSSKVWLFFTRRFIRKYKFQWWFHVAPMVHVVINNEVKERIMDIKYAKGPIPLKRWTDIFLRDSADCPVVDKYSDQANYPESGSCFVMKSSMYYYQPLDLEDTELTGTPKSIWLEPEVTHAYKDAFEMELPGGQE